MGAGVDAMAAGADADCVFCRIAAGLEAASPVFEDERVLAFVDLRQFNPGHVLVIPRAHLHDVRDLDEATGSALMAAVARVTRVVAEVFPNEGISLWHSIGEAAFQEVPHLHIHVHPRRLGDGALRIYPREPTHAGREVLDDYAARLRARLAEGG